MPISPINGPRNNELNDSTFNLQTNSNPFDAVPLIKEVTGNFQDVADLLILRQVNSKWKQEATTSLIKKLSLKQTISFKTPEEITRFTATFKQSLLHDSFKFDLAQEFKSSDEFYTKFVSLAGSSAKCLDLSALDPNLNDFFTFWNWSYVKEYFLGSSVAQTCPCVQMEKFLIEKILFSHFPHLVELRIKEFKYTCSQHQYIFHSQKERTSNFNSHLLPMLTSLSIAFKEKNHSKDPLCFLSDELMKISPNLKIVKLVLEPELNADSVVKQILSTVVKYNLQIKRFGVSTQRGNLFEKVPEKEIRLTNFANLKINRLSFKDQEYNFEFQKNRLDFFNSSLQLAFTLEHFSQTLLKPPCFKKIIAKNADDEFNKILSMILPTTFANLKVLKLMIQFHCITPKTIAVFNVLAKGSPLIEKFTTSSISITSDGLAQWGKLKKLVLSQIVIHWDSVEGFHKLHQFVQTLAPILEDLKVHLECCETQNRKGLFLAYPFLVWMGSNWKSLEECEVSVNKRLRWNKGAQETKLGIGSIKALSDEKGDFTLGEITEFDISLVLSFKVFMKEEGFTEFLNWLKSTFPKRKTFNHFVQVYNESLDNFKKIFTPSVPNYLSMTI